MLLAMSAPVSSYHHACTHFSSYFFKVLQSRLFTSPIFVKFSHFRPTAVHLLYLQLRYCIVRHVGSHALGQLRQTSWPDAKVLGNLPNVLLFFRVLRPRCMVEILLYFVLFDIHGDRMHTSLRTGVPALSETTSDNHVTLFMLHNVLINQEALETWFNL